jgi:hypothetical protein
MSIIVIKNMADKFNHRHAEYVHPRLLGKHDRSYASAYRNSLFNIQNKSGFWGRFQLFLAECCDKMFSTHIIANQQEAIREEIKTVSASLFSQLPDHSQITSSTKKSLYTNKQQGYSIVLEGFKLVAHFGVEVVESTKKGIEFKNKSELIDLTNKDKYDNLMYDLKAVHIEDEWASYMESTINNLILKLDDLKGSSIEFAKQHHELFMEETGLDIFKLTDGRVDKEQLGVLVKFNLANNFSPELATRINKFNSTLLKEIFLYKKSMAEDKAFVQSEPGIIAATLLTVLWPINNSVAATRKANQAEQANLLNDLFGKIVRTGNLEDGLERAKVQDSQVELFGIISSVERNLPLFEQLQPDTQSVLYTNYKKGYRLVQEGKSVFLYSKPFALANQLKIEIKTLSLASRNDYNKVKKRLNANKVWDLVKQFQYERKIFIEDLVPIVHKFATDYEDLFNELFTVRRAQELGITLTEDLDINQINPNAQYLEHLVLFFLLLNNDVFNRLDLLGFSIGDAYAQFSKLATLHDVVNDERVNASFLHEVMQKLKVSRESNLEILEAFRKEQPELFYRDDDVALLKLFDYDKKFHTYAAQRKTKKPKLDTFDVAVRDNGVYFKKDVFVGIGDLDKSIPEHRQEEVENYEKYDPQFLSQKDDEEMRQALLESKRGGFDMLRLMTTKVDGGTLAEHYLDGDTLAEHYLFKPYKFYEMVGMSEHEIPDYPISDENGEKKLNPILGKKVKAYLAQNRYIFKLSKEHNYSQAGSMVTSKTVSPAVIIEPEPLEEIEHLDLEVGDDLELEDLSVWYESKLRIINQSISKLAYELATLPQKLPDIEAKIKKFDQQAKDIQIRCDAEIARRLTRDSIIDFTKETHSGIKEAAINFIQHNYEQDLEALKREIEDELQSLVEIRDQFKDGLEPASLIGRSTRRVTDSLILNANQEEIEQSENHKSYLEYQLKQALKITTSKGKNEKSERIKSELVNVSNYLQEIRSNSEAKGKEKP